MLAEVGYEERLVGYEMSPATGNAPRSLYSFREVCDFLRVGNPEDLLTKGSHSSIGYLDLEELRRWIGSVLGDRDLAEAIGRELEAHKTYRERVDAARELMRQRLEQCRAALSE
ncbi:MAG: hypothetical protein QME79_14830 [Bacillota bacterium]|nr:hypothetical protein [Bacillota bacterium]